MRTLNKSFSALVGFGLAVATGCGSTQHRQDERPASSALVVVGWSLRSQAPIPVRGAIYGKDKAAAATFETRRDPAAGATIEGLTPGSYRIEIKARYAGEKEVPAKGEESVYLEPGSKIRREVVVDDRGTEVGIGPAEASGG